jgi:Na+-driven multidrug efflux pump
MGMMYAFLMAIYFTTNETSIYGTFTHNEAVMADLASTWTMFTLFCIVDQIQGIAVSVMVVSGRQGLGGIITWIGYGLIGVSLLSYNVFVRGGGLESIWTAAIIAVAFNSVCFLTVGFTTDWEKVSKEAAERRQKEQNEIKQVEQADPEDNKFVKAIQ